MMTNVNCNDGGDNSGIYTNIQSLCCTAEINMSINTSIKKINERITSAAP